MYASGRKDYGKDYINGHERSAKRGSDRRAKEGNRTKGGGNALGEETEGKREKGGWEMTNKEREQRLREIVADSPLNDEPLTAEQEQRLRRHLERLDAEAETETEESLVAAIRNARKKAN